MMMLRTDDDLARWRQALALDRPAPADSGPAIFLSYPCRAPGRAAGGAGRAMDTRPAPLAVEPAPAFVSAG